MVKKQHIKTLFKYGIVMFFMIITGLESVIARPYLKIHEVHTDNYPYVTADVSVTNVAPIDDLDESSFEVFENGWKVNFFQVRKIEPLSNPKHIVLLIDASRSLNEQQFKTQISAVRGFVQKLNVHDKIAIVSFADTVQVRCAFTSSREQIKECIQSIQRVGSRTLLYDAIREAWSLSLSSTGKRNSIVVFSDGKEEGSSVKINDLTTLAKTIRIPTFVVSAGQQSDLAPLLRISHLSGGETYHSPTLDNVGKIYVFLHQLMDSTYQVKYRSQAENGSSAEGRTSIEVRFRNGELHDQDIVFFTGKAGILKLVSEKTGLKERDLLFILGLIIIAITVITFLVIINNTKKKRSFSTKVQGGRKPSDVSLADGYFENGQNVDKANYTNKKVPSQSKTISLDYQHAYILEKEGANTGRKYPIRWHNINIGHGDENTIVLEDPTVSYTHAKIELRREEFYLFDTMSEHGVFLNGRKILRPKILQDFDQIELGRTVLIFRKAAG